MLQNEDGANVFSTLRGSYEREASNRMELVTVMTGTGLNLSTNIEPKVTESTIRRFNNFSVETNTPPTAVSLFGVSLSFYELANAELNNSEITDPETRQSRTSRSGFFSNMFWSGATDAPTSLQVRDAQVGLETATLLNPEFAGIGREQVGHRVVENFVDNTLRVTLAEPRNETAFVTVSSIGELETSYTQLSEGVLSPATFGVIDFVGSSGDTASLFLVNSLVRTGVLPDNVYGDEVINYSINHDGMQTELTKPSASLFIPWFVD